MCEEQFEAISEVEGASNLDSAVVDVSREIIDDYPASDPRWAEAVPSGKLNMGGGRKRALTSNGSIHYQSFCGLSIF